MASDAVKEAVENLRQAMLDDDMDEGTVNAKLAAVIPNENNLVGNFADLQRLGALVADDDVDNTEALDGAVEVPPGAVIDGEPVEGTRGGTGGYDTWTKAELQAELDRQGVEYPVSATKAELIEALG